MRPGIVNRRLLAGILGFAFSTLFVASATQAQQNANGGVVVARLMIQTLSNECIRIHPDMAAEVKANLDAWLALNAAQLSAADAEFASLSREQKASLAQVFETIEQHGRKALSEIPAQHESRLVCGNIISSFGNPSETGHLDADNYMEALGMFRMHMLIVQTAVQRCSADFPSLVPNINLAEKVWRERDADVIATIESAASINRDEWAEVDRQATRSAHSLVDAAFQADMGERFCGKFIDELATGAKRTQNPRMYAFLENGPDRN